MILFGEWAVVDGGPGVASALGSRFDVDIFADDSHAGYAFASSDGERTELASLDTLPDGYFAFAARAVAALAKRRATSRWRGRTLRFRREWRIDEGLGSSSALVVALCALDRALHGEARPAATALWRHAREILRETQSPRASGLDVAAQTLGGHVLLEGDEPHPIQLEIPRALHVLHTGQKMSTAKALRDMAPPAEALDQLRTSTRAFLRERQWSRAIDEHFEVLQTMGVVPADIAALRSEWQRRGWISTLKTTGAGGGDALLVWAPDGIGEPLRREVEARGWWWGQRNFGAEGFR